MDGGTAVKTIGTSGAQSASPVGLRPKHLVFLGVVAFGLVFLVLQAGTRLAREHALAEIRARLEAQVAVRMELVNSREAMMHREVLFLASLPAVQSIAKSAKHPGSNRSQMGREEAWKQQLATIFLGFARTDPEILHMKFLGMADSGKELVRIDRVNNALLVAPEGQLLQLAKRDYFIQTARCRPGETFLSELNLDRINGVVVVPHIPILRVGAPVFGTDGIMEGMIFVSIDARPLLDDFRNTLMVPFETYLTNERGDFLCHPNKEMNFGFDLGAPHRWQDEFLGSDTIDTIDTAARWVQRSTTPVGSLLVVAKRVPLGKSGRYLVVRSTYPDSALQATVSNSRNTTLSVAAGILGFGGLLLFLYLGLQRGVRRRIEELNTDLERQVRERTMEIEAFSSFQTTILATAGSAIIATDTEGIVTLFNPAAEAMLGYDSSEVVGRMTPLHFRDGQELGTLAEDLSRKNGVPVAVDFEFILESDLRAPAGKELTYVRKDGSHLPVLLTVRPLRNMDGGIFGYLGIAIDLTERHKFEDDLRLRTMEAVAANHSKAEFLANMSHEIRTPLSAMLGLAQVLENRILEPQASELVRKIRRAGTSLQSLIDDVLDFSKIEAGHLELEHAPFRLDDILDNLATIMGMNAGSKRIELVIGALPAGTSRLIGDAHRLEQVLINLTGNAIKFTERGSVTVSMDLVSRKNDQVTLRFSVRDTGIGIPREKQAGIFDSFSQADTSTTRRFGGTGLGLAISRLLVEKMGGQIEVESEAGAGCEFRFTTVLQTAGPEEPKEHKATPIMNLHVLVADDNDLSREAISAVAESIGWRIDSVGSGAEAIERMLERIHGENPFDVLLIDWRMPELDGLSTVLQLRQRLENKTPSIVLLATAHSREELADIPESHTVDGILSKPLTGSSLYNAVMQARSRRGENLPIEPSRGEARLSGIRVLVVDDNEAIRELMVAIFQDEGATVRLAKNGEIAVHLLKATPGGVDIVLMDVQMPVMDGYMAARLIRSTPELETLPIVALSAGVFQSEQEAALEAGMDAFLPKPFQVTDLVRVIRSLTGNPLPDAPAAEAEGSSSGQESTSMVIDVARGKSQWKSQQAFFGRLRKFATEYEGFMEDIALHAGPDDSRNLAFALHKLKGTAGILAMTELTGQAERLRRIVHEGGDPLPTLPELGKSMDEVLARIAELVPKQA
jgi:PAS domain S-box-containing protein